MDCSIVVPTIGRASLRTLFASLERADGARDVPIFVVDDRATPEPPLSLDARVHVLHSGGAGPAAARNRGWKAATTQWVCFLDDDVEVEADWWRMLEADLASAQSRDGGIQASIDVPLPAERAPSDWERNVAGLAKAEWITADMLYRREALAEAGGFDERFRRAYREDSDLAIRVERAGWRLRRGLRRTRHPVRRADRWISVRLQRGNADDALMRAKHGKAWRSLAHAPRGRFRRHAATVACAAIAAVSGLAWSALVAEFAWKRIAPGPRTRDEIAAMIATSAVIPFAAVYHRLAGTFRAKRSSA